MSKKLTSLALGAMLLALSFPAEAQQPTKVPRIGLLVAGSASSFSPLIEGFRQGLRDLRYTDAQNIAIEYRYAEGKVDRLADLLAELVRLKLDVIVVGGGVPTSALKNAAKTIPIVLAGGGDPVESGLVASLARPGSNITGLATLSPLLSGKRLGLLKEAVPGLSRVAVLANPSSRAFTSALKETEGAAQVLQLQLQILQGARAQGFRQHIWSRQKGPRWRPSSFFTAHSKEVVEIAAKNRWRYTIMRRLSRLVGSWPMGRA